MRDLKWVVLVLFLLSGAGACIYSCGPGGSGPIDKLTLDDGSAYLVMQQWYGIGELFSIGFWYKEKDGRWGWCYIDHEASRWRDGMIAHNPTSNSVQVFRGDALRAELFIEKQTFALYYSGGSSRELPAPQEWRDPHELRD